MFCLLVCFFRFRSRHIWPCRTNYAVRTRIWHGFTCAVSSFHHTPPFSFTFLFNLLNLEAIIFNSIPKTSCLVLTHHRWMCWAMLAITFLPFAHLSINYFFLSKTTLIITSGPLVACWSLPFNDSARVASMVAQAPNCIRSGDHVRQRWPWACLLTIDESSDLLLGILPLFVLSCSFLLPFFHWKPLPEIRHILFLLVLINFPIQKSHSRSFSGLGSFNCFFVHFEFGTETFSLSWTVHVPLFICRPLSLSLSLSLPLPIVYFWWSRFQALKLKMTSKFLPKTLVWSKPV